MESPDCKTNVRDLNDGSQPFRLGVKLWVSQEAADKNRYLSFLDRKVYETISGMTQPTVVEIRIAGEKRGTPQVEKKGYKLLVLQSSSSYIVSHVTNRNPPVP
jgi:hypothetical protein